MTTDKLTKRYPPLTPITSTWMEQVIEEPSLLEDLFGQYGSPVNLHHLKPFGDNYRAYREVFRKHDLKHTVFFARKANKCRAFAAEAERLDFGVDTASYRELKQCLEAGCAPRRLVLTAAVKDERLLRLALSEDVLIILDNRDECRQVNELAAVLGKTPKAGVRISGFEYKGEKLYSRFGFDIGEAENFICRHFGREQEYHNLRFGGFHFHLDGYSIEQRGTALHQTIDLADQLAEQGFETSFIDMGGGLLTQYLQDEQEWNSFWDELKRAVRGERDPITFGNNGLGYTVSEGRLQGQANVYPYYNETPKTAFLDQMLAYTNKDGKSAAGRLRERDIEIRIEPGRSLLDQAGMTLAKVAYRKQDQRGDWLVGLNMNRSQLFSSSAEFLLDPTFIPAQSAGKDPDPTAVYFTGAYCLEQDQILKRKIPLPHLPEIGDIIAFPNTAGYMMHFYETEAHLFELAQNLVTAAEGNLDFIPDCEWPATE